MTDKTQALLPVTQSDRDAAADAQLARGLSRGEARRLREGDADDHWMVQAFARHRISHSLPGDVGMREALEKAAVRFEVCAQMISGGHDISGTRRAEQTIKAKHFATEALAALTPSALSGEHCQRCGHNNPSWSAPSPLWNAVIRGGSIDGEPKFDDMVCAACFMELAEQQGIASDWTVKARNVAVPLETTTPSGRVWDEDKGLWVSAVSGDAGEGE